MRGEVHNPQQAPPPSWKVDVPPEPGTHRMRHDEILQTLKVPPPDAQLAVDKLRLAAQIATSQQALSTVVSSA